MSSLTSYIAKKVLRMEGLVMTDAFKLIKVSIDVQQKWINEDRDIVRDMSSLLMEIKKTYNNSK